MTNQKAPLPEGLFYFNLFLIFDLKTTKLKTTNKKN